MSLTKFTTKLWNDYGIGALIILLIVAYGVLVFFGYLGNKGSSGYESNSGIQQQYKNTNAMASSTVAPSDPNGNEVFSSATGIQTSTPGIPSSCSKPNIQNPDELLPKDTNSQWAQLNPSGKGYLNDVNLLKAGYHIGIDTIGQTLRNANLQIRSEPPNPQVPVSIWNNSTITSDFARIPLEIGSGVQ
jgi:hypothetical protein